MKPLKSLSFKTERDLLLVNILSALLVAVIAFFPNSPVRIILVLPFILFFSGYVLICALFPRKEDLDWVERLALSMGLSMAVASLIGLALNYTAFGIRLYSVTFSLFSFIILMSAVAIYRRRAISPEDVFSPLALISMSGWIKNEFVKFGNVNRIIKITAIIAFIFITLSAILIKNTENSGYEASIYTAIPFLSWVFLIIGIVCGICIAVHSVYTKEYEKNNKWALGLFLILLSDSIILSLPLLRGYTFWGRGDPFTHIITVLNIVSSGHIADKNFYPIAHIYVAEFSLLSNVPVEILFMFIPLLFAILFVVYAYLFAKSILPNKGQVILATIAITAFQSGWYLNLTPNHLSNFMIPFAFFIFFKSYESTSRLKTEFRILLIIMIFLYGAFHPVPAIALLFLFIAVGLFDKILSTKDSNDFTRKFTTTSSLILAVWTISWLSSFGVWGSTIRNIHTVMAEGGPTALSTMGDKIAYASGYGYSPLEMFLKHYTGILIYITLALIALPIIMKEARENKSFKNIGSLYSPLAAYFLITAVFFLSDIGFGPLRMLIYLLILCTVFVGFMLNRLLEKTKHSSKKSLVKPAIVFIIIFILVFSSIHGILKLYPSPYLLSYNNQVTNSEIEGMEWFFDTRNAKTSLLVESLSEMMHRRGIIMRKLELPPYHFNYNNCTALGESYTEDKYMALNKLDKLLYVEVWPEMAELRWYPSDYDKLEDDASLDKLYSNGGFDVWYVYALK